jgi:hypothetical protein
LEIALLHVTIGVTEPSLGRRAANQAQFRLVRKGRLDFGGNPLAVLRRFPHRLDYYIRLGDTELVNDSGAVG